MSYFEHPEFWEKLNDTQKIVAVYSAALPLFELYDAICAEETKFERPDQGTIELCSRLGAMAMRPALVKYPTSLLITDFPYLEGKLDDIRREWFECRPKFSRYLQVLRIEIIQRKADQNKLYQDVILNAAYMQIQNYKKLKESKLRWVEHKQGRQRPVNSYPESYFFKENAYFAGDAKHILRFRKDSLQGKIMNLLDERKGDLIDAVVIAKRTRISAPEVRRAITTIRSRVKKDKQIAISIKIENVRGKGYKLTPLIKSNKPPLARTKPRTS